MPSVDPDGVELQSSDHATLHAELNSIARGMGFFYSNGCDAEHSITSGRGDFRHALSGAGSF
jgi:hypothetical protein